MCIHAHSKDVPETVNPKLKLNPKINNNLINNIEGRIRKARTFPEPDKSNRKFLLFLIFLLGKCKPSLTLEVIDVF